MQAGHRGALEFLKRDQRILNGSTTVDYEPADSIAAARKIWKDYKRYRMSDEIPDNLLEEVWRVMYLVRVSFPRSRIFF
ncbi:MAG: hypothetical protein MN733_22345 [Nitrososphaera sp.]|nr:hypothetical protein [Nitrososphaera sp.]